MSNVKPEPVPEVEGVKVTYLAVGETMGRVVDATHAGADTVVDAKGFGIQRLIDGLWASFSIEQRFTLPGVSLGQSVPIPPPVKAKATGPFGRG